MIQGHVLTSLVFSELGFGFKSHSPRTPFLRTWQLSGSGEPENIDDTLSLELRPTNLSAKLTSDIDYLRANFHLCCPKKMNLGLHIPIDSDSRPANLQSSGTSLPSSYPVPLRFLAS
jgi:hypothetical protein